MRAALLLAALLVAGCLGSPPAQEPATAPPPTPASTGLFEGSECRGVKTAGSFRGGSTAGTAPPGWEPDPAVENRLFYFIAECSRVATLAFERPLSFVIEGHQRFRAPDACTEGMPGLPLMVSAVWVGDAEVAARWAQQFGLPAAHASIHRTDGTSLGLPGWTWAWSVAGGLPSRVEAFSGATQPTELEGGSRLFWPRPGDRGIGVSDLLWNLQTHTDRNPVQAGELQPPTLWSQGLSTRYAGLGDLFASSQLHAGHRAYGDLGCREPDT